MPILPSKWTINIWEYKIGNNVNIANFVHLWKNRIRAYVGKSKINSAEKSLLLIFQPTCSKVDNKSLCKEEQNKFNPYNSVIEVSEKISQKLSLQRFQMIQSTQTWRFHMLQ